MTEEEARKKFCPYSMQNVVMATCIGSQCMAWVWDVPPDRVDEYNPIPKGHCGMVK